MSNGENYGGIVSTIQEMNSNYSTPKAYPHNFAGIVKALDDLSNNIGNGSQGGGNTNLSYDSATRTVISSTGTDVTLTLAVAAGHAGLLTGSDKTQLDNLTTNLSGKANLVNGKLVSSELPDIAITEFLGTVTNQTQMLALIGQEGDWAIRSDEGKVYIITGSDPSQIGSWTSLSYPGSDVQSVNGLTGVVTLDADDISDTGTTNKFTSAAEITKLAGIESGAQANVSSDWDSSSGDSQILNKPLLYNNSSVDTHLNTGSASSNEVLSWTGSDYDWVAQSGGGGGAVDSVNSQTGNVVLDADDISDSTTTNKFTTSVEATKLAGIQAGAEVNVATNLTYTASTRTIGSSTGTDAVLTEVVAAGNSGLMTGADKTKLNGVEAGATTDQTDAEIKTAYENNSNTNAFTDAEKSKLSGVEAGATTDQTAAEIKTAYESNADTNEFSDAEKTKLGTVATNADVSPTNISELTNDSGYITNNITTDVTISDTATDSSAGPELTLYRNSASPDDEDYLGQLRFLGKNANGTDKLYAKVTGKISDVTTGTEDGLIEIAVINDGSQTIVARHTKDCLKLINGVGLEVAGDITVDGTVDGRDIATDGTKLDGIEAGATADQTASEIKTAYESNANTNAFTDTQVTKLSGIATGAEVNVQANWNEASSSSDAFIQNKPTIPAAYTDSNVDTHLNTGSASSNEVLSWTGSDYDWVAQSGGGGAVDSVNSQTGTVVLDADDISDSSTTNKYTTAADISKLAGIESGATADQSATEIKTAYESNSNTNAFTDAEQTKLSGVAAGAEVNVQSDWNASSGDSQILNKPTIPAAYTNSDVDTHLNTSSASSNEVLSWTGSDYDWVAQSGGGGGTTAADCVKYLGTGTPNVNTTTSYSEVSWINTTPTFSSGTWSATATRITVPSDGKYLVSVNLYFTASVVRSNVGVSLGINGTIQPEIDADNYIRNTAGHNEASAGITTTLDLSANDEISIYTQRLAAAGTVTLVGTSSTIAVTRIDQAGPQGPAGVSDIPINSQTSAYTLVAGDNGKAISITTGGITVPSGVFNAGNVVSLYNNSTSNQTITQGSSVTLRLAGTATTGNRTLAQYGMATLLCVSSNEFVISGSGLT